MNKCFFIGRILENIDLKFIKHKNKIKNNSITLFKLQLLDKNYIKVKAYNEIADFCYRKLRKDDIVFLLGILEQDGLITIKYIKKI